MDKGKVHLTVANRNLSTTGQAVVITPFRPEFTPGRNLLKAFRSLTIYFSYQPIAELGAIRIVAWEGGEPDNEVTVQASVAAPGQSVLPLKERLPKVEGRSPYLLLQPSVKLFQNMGLTMGNAVLDCTTAETLVPVMNVCKTRHLLTTCLTLGQALVAVEQAEIGQRGDDSTNTIKQEQLSRRRRSERH